METPRPPKVYSHPTSASSVTPILRQLLPYPIALYRRLQFPHRSPHSRVLATFPPDDGKAQPDPAACFAVAYVDRSRRPETECWIFLSGEVPGRCSASAGERAGGSGRRGSTSAPPCRRCAKALFAVLEHIAKLDLPPSAHPEEVLRATTAGDGEPVDEHEAHRAAHLAHHAKPSIMLLGAVSALARQILNQALLAPRAYVGGDIPYDKYLFPIDALAESDELPRDLRWAKVREKDLALVKSRTGIPRQDGTLRLLPSLAVSAPASPESPDPSPVAWGFLGLDASLSTLQVEPAYRGCGIAKKLTAKLFREGHAGVFDLSDEEGGGIAHTDTAGGNEEAIGVFKSLGGRFGWTVYWIRVDLDRVREPLSSGALEAIAKLDADLPRRERIWEQPSDESGQ